MWSTGGLLGLIFGGPVPLASQNLYPIIVILWPYYRPHLSHFGGKRNFRNPNLVTLTSTLLSLLTRSSWNELAHLLNILWCKSFFFNIPTYLNFFPPNAEDVGPHSLVVSLKRCNLIIVNPVVKMRLHPAAIPISPLLESTPPPPPPPLRVWRSNVGLSITTEYIIKKLINICSQNKVFNLAYIPWVDRKNSYTAVIRRRGFSFILLTTKREFCLSWKSLRFVVYQVDSFTRLRFWPKETILSFHWFGPAKS